VALEEVLQCDASFEAGEGCAEGREVTAVPDELFVATWVEMVRNQLHATGAHCRPEATEN
jgi:hypothetical protein